MAIYPVRQQYLSDTPVQLLARPVNALLAVSTQAASLLDGLGVKTVFDLGASFLFATARKIADAASGVQAIASMPVARDAIDATAAALTMAQLADSRLLVLRNVDETLAQSFAKTLGIETVREMAAWPPYKTAQTIVNDAYGLGPEFQDDPERPTDLVPVARQYATERVQYDVLVLDHVLDQTNPQQPFNPTVGPDIGAHLQNTPQKNLLDIRTAGGIDVADIVSATLVAQPALGAVLTYRQSWFPQGLALGHLLHSLALAPGESTRIAMVDWTRRVRASTDEVTAQIEALSASMERMRAISEVTSAVAHEAQSGFSELNSSATSNQSATTTGSASLSIELKPLAGQLEALLTGGGLGGVGTTSRGTSSATSTNTGWASSSASSTGDRTLNAQMMQNVADRTQQAANSSRNRRATAITESSQAESEKLSTRVVANYNHMHALTVLYFEVVQVYRVVLELARATPALFLPMKLVSFTQPTIRRFRHVIAAAGLTPSVRALAWVEPGQILITAPSKAGPWDASWLRFGAQALGEPIGNPEDFYVALPRNGLTVMALGGDVQELFSEVIVEGHDGSIRRAAIPAPTPHDVYGWGGFSASPAGVNQVAPQNIRRWILVRRAGKEDLEGVIGISLLYDVLLPDGTKAGGKLDAPTLVLPVAIRYRKNESRTVAFEFLASQAQSAVVEHLDQNALHYSAAIWRSLDAATITTLLSTYTLGGSRLIESIDPVPVAVSGNYLVFRFYGTLGNNDWSTLKAKLGTDMTPREDMVPLPSGGVFAEAVLGRSNSAEKLDITRFWNWQDSPIPILPSEINPLTAGGKANDKTPETGKLESPVVNIVNPPSLPDPAGLGPLYTAIANGNMFRDMSGLAQTSALIGAALQAAQAGAANATGAAGEAQNVASRQLTEILKLAAQVAGGGMASGAAAGVGALGGASKPGVANTPTNAGALINHGKSMDDRRLTDTLPPSSAGPATPSEDPVSEWLPYPGDESSNGSTSGKRTVGREAQAADVALTGGGGDGTLMSKFASLLMSMIMGADLESDRRARSAQLELAKKIIGTDSSKFGACSKKALDEMRERVDTFELLGAGTVGGTIITWIPKSVEELIVGSLHTAEALMHVDLIVKAVAGLPTILQRRLRDSAQLALLTCQNLTAEEKNFWRNMDQLLK